MAEAGICAWCGKHHERLSRAGEPATCCSKQCLQEWEKHGWGASKAQIAERRAHIAKQPRGCKTVEEFLAAGGTILKEAAQSAKYGASSPRDGVFSPLMGGRAR